MKLFWKIFFTTMFVSITCLALGGYILIRSNLSAMLDHEVQIAYDYGDIAYYALANELKMTPTVILKDDMEETAQVLSEAAQASNIRSMNQTISFGIITRDGNVIYTSIPENLDKTLRDSLKNEEKGWSLKEADHGIYVQAIRPVSFYEEPFFLETIRDVTYIFDGQKSQYETLLKIMIGILFGAGLITFLVSRLLIRRVRSLIKVTKDISNGDLRKRARLKGDDEITVLSKDFNRMADSLEDKIETMQEEGNKKEMFIGAFSHELKTPLTSIIGYSDMIRRKEMSREKIQVCADYIFTEGKRLESISMKLMDLVILKNHELELSSVKIDDFLLELTNSLVPQLEQTNIHVSCRMQPAIIKFEPDLMKTVFNNLIDNSRKAIGKDGSIYVNGTMQDGIYQVSIRDTGKGMERQELNKIKEAFYMIDKSRSRQQGSAGLGLAICDEIIQLHGFEIKFDSIVGTGTIVTIAMKGDSYAFS